MEKCIVFCAAEFDALLQPVKPEDFVIAADGGLRHTQSLGLTPNEIIGDFDSHPDPHLPVETITLPREKDDTDTVFAVKEAVRRGYDDFLLIGAVGGRLDHTLGNVSILLYLDSVGRKGSIIDDYSEMEIVSGSAAYIDDSWEFFSLLNITGCARGITITGAKYPLDDGEITCDYQYGISNEVIPGERAAVTLREGRLLLIKICRQ